MSTNFPTRLAFLALLFLTPVTTSAAPPEPTDVRELRLELKEVELELAERIGALERMNSLVFGVIGVSLVTLIFGWSRWVRKAEQAAEERLETIVASRPGAILKLIADYDAEKELRETTQVKIVSKTLEIERVLRQHGFKRIQTLAADAAATLEPDDAVIFDLEDGVDEPRATEILETRGLEHVLVFSYGRAKLPPGRTTFANSYVTLFSRLQELLRFKAAEARD
jgi:hypothetical protein